MGRLDGKVAVITGATGGIGEVTALLFAREGAKVVATDIPSEKLAELIKKIEEAGGEGLAVIADVTKFAELENVMDKAVEKFGKIDILCNIAGIQDNFFTTVSIDEDLWERNYMINQRGTFFSCRAALKHMEAAGSGSIINVSSIAGLFGTLGVAYSATKHAIIGISKNIAVQYAGTGIRCNVLAPGPTITAMSNDDSPLDFEMMKKTGLHFNDSISFCDPIDQANAMLFFASDDAKAVNGQVLVVDKGRTL